LENHIDISEIIQNEFKLKPLQVSGTLKLFAEDATIPFIARYRKEITGNLDEEVLRNIKDRYEYLLELQDRKKTVLKTISEQGKLTKELERKITLCLDKAKLEDLYLPYKPKRKTRAKIAIEKGLEPLLLAILQCENNSIDLPKEALKYIDIEKGVKTVDEALRGAADIFAEVIAERAESRDYVRSFFQRQGVFSSKVKKDFKDKSTKFEMYYNYTSSVRDIPSHNMLALRRAEKEGVISFGIEVNDDEIIDWICSREIKNKPPELYQFMKAAIKDGYTRLMKTSIGSEIRLIKKQDADLIAINNFEKNLRNVLLASPAGFVPILAVDPGFRSGCKVAALDATGKFLSYKAIFPHPPQKQEVEAGSVLINFIKKFKPSFISIGNGTASRETETFIKKIVKNLGQDLKPKVLLVSESGASVYSASPIAKKEFPDLDVTVRGAISIGRRLMDPLAELVKIDPKSIGVGQYQHDVDQKLLAKKLGEVVESCVNFVGVDLNSASAELLTYVSGINQNVACNIILKRDQKGPYKNRKELLKVPKLGEKAFEQAAGFLRIQNGDNPLDNTSVHPESYFIVERIARDLNVSLTKLLSNEEMLKMIDSSKYTDSNIGLITITDIINELKKPGRDPRKEFEYASFREDIVSMDDLNEGMMLEGVVSNVTNFGAFVDIGVHQDGLIHVSEMADKFVKDPTQIVQVGQKVQVRVININVELKRIALSLKKGDQPSKIGKTINKDKKTKNGQSEKKSKPQASLNDLMDKFNRR